MKICKNCGLEFDEDKKVCPGCGSIGGEQTEKDVPVISVPKPEHAYIPGAENNKKQDEKEEKPISKLTYFFIIIFAIVLIAGTAFATTWLLSLSDNGKTENNPITEGVKE